MSVQSETPSGKQSVLYLSESVCNFSELSDISLLFPKLDAAMIKYLIVFCPRTVYGGVLMEQ